jgi:hypothetical protein
VKDFARELPTPTRFPRTTADREAFAASQIPQDQRRLALVPQAKDQDPRFRRLQEVVDELADPRDGRSARSAPHCQRIAGGPGCQRKSGRHRRKPPPGPRPITLAHPSVQSTHQKMRRQREHRRPFEASPEVRVARAQYPNEGRWPAFDDNRAAQADSPLHARGSDSGRGGSRQRGDFLP